MTAVIGVRGSGMLFDLSATVKRKIQGIWEFPPLFADGGRARDWGEIKRSGP